mgnify:CR=1 FL=1
MLSESIDLLVKVCEPVNVAIEAVSDKSVEAIVIFALPLNDCPAIVLAVSNIVAVAALPLVSWLPLELTPGKSMLAVPSNDTPPIFLAVANAVAVAALPVVDPEEPDTLPVTLPSKLATNVPVVIVKFPVLAPVNEPVPTLNLSSLSSNPINALSELPLSITKPASLAGVPEVPFPNSNSESETTVLVVDTVVVVPFTVKSPVTVASPATVKLVPFNNCKESDLNLAVIVCVPALMFENSNKPSSLPSEASSILLVTLA